MDTKYSWLAWSCHGNTDKSIAAHVGCWDAVQLPPADNSVNGRIFTVVSVAALLVDPCLPVPEKTIKVHNITLVNVYVDLLVFTRIAGTS